VSTRVREAVAIVVVLALVLVLEAFSLKSGTIGLVLIGVVAVLAVAVIVFRVSFRLAGVGAACLASLTLTWHGVFLGPIRPGDALIFVALLCFIVADPNHAFGTPPWWVKQLIFVLLFLAMIQIFFPPDPVYLAQRITFDAGQPEADQYRRRDQVHRRCRGDPDGIHRRGAGRQAGVAVDRDRLRRRQCLVRLGCHG
jgi:hypothetical protein